MNEIMLIDEDGTNLGNMEYDKAKTIADDKNMYLKLVNRTNQVYRIVDRGKMSYERKRKARQKHAQKRAQKIKEIQIRPTIEDRDLEVKLNNAKKFLSKGLKTRIVMKFKKQQLTYKEAGMQKMLNIINDFVESGLATTDTDPQLDGRRIVIVLSPTK